MKIFYDVDTQNDFMNKDGALYVPDAELIKPNLADLTQYARVKKIVVAGSVDKHFGTEEYKARELELARWGGPFPDHCMDLTFGQEKVNATIPDPVAPLRDYAIAEGNTLFVPHFLDNAQPSLQECLTHVKKVKAGEAPRGIYFEKQSYNVFTNSALEVFLKKAEVREAVVYGVATDFCVKAAVLGMQQRGVQCYVVEDAIKGVFPDKTKEALEEMVNAGAKLVTTKDVLEGRL